MAEHHFRINVRIRGDEKLVDEALDLIKAAMTTTKTKNDSKELLQLRSAIYKGWAKEFDAQDDIPIVEWAPFESDEPGFTKQTEFGKKDHFNIEFLLGCSGATKVYNNLIVPLVEFFTDLDFFVISQHWEDFGYGFHLSFYIFGEDPDRETPDDREFDCEGEDLGGYWFVTAEEFDEDPEKFKPYLDAVLAVDDFYVEEGDEIPNNYKSQAVCNYFLNNDISYYLARWLLGHKMIEDDNTDDDFCKKIKQNEKICMEAIILGGDSVERFIDITITPKMKTALKKDRDKFHLLFMP